MSTEKDIAERLRAAFVQHHGNKVGDPFVSQISLAATRRTTSEKPSVTMAR